ncbi:L,D-transpeptidase family protein [Sphingobium sp. HBC34]|uniref:L,D-transpeptidase family protein n=1 Tax=Sphingobium cyanobacteriorum TaxID=3063954 RepID=A0ABT8ZGF4_9SPHN|nr:L,D-transpeptidase family protein [Sphingobium sp. HBC34]MDO7833622.1 L,D-transpeptidase family protein [Sphingobium sp. HBC34]
MKWEKKALKYPMLFAALLCSACNVSVTDANDSAPQETAPTNAAQAQGQDPHAFQIVEESASNPISQNKILQAQVALDRRGFSPAVLDGKDGMSFKAALRGFQAARDLPVTGALDAKTGAALLEGDARPATWLVRIPDGFARGPFFDIPRGLNEQASLPALTYRNLLEKLAERFHTTPEALMALNPPGTKVAAGATVRVPAIDNQPVAQIEGDDRGWGETLASLAVAKTQPQADHIVVDKSEGLLKAYDADNRLIAQFPVTTGSQHDPLPLGEWTIKGVSRNPDFHYNPDLFWDASSTDKKAMLRPGPNGPVGVVWIDLSKDHYGIHGTPEPQMIGRTQSHGCIRLTNWDAARLAQMVKSGVKAKFQA